MAWVSIASESILGQTAIPLLIDIDLLQQLNRMYVQSRCKKLMSQHIIMASHMIMSGLLCRKRLPSTLSLTSTSKVKESCLHVHYNFNPTLPELHVQMYTTEPLHLSCYLEYIITVLCIHILVSYMTFINTDKGSWSKITHSLLTDI